MTQDLKSMINPYLSIEQIAEVLCKNKATIRKRVHEIESETGAGKRYADADHVVIDDFKIKLVNYFAFLDWMENRRRLQNPSTRAMVNPYDPISWARAFGCEEVTR